MIVNYLGQSIPIASPPPLLTLCCQTPTWFLKGNDSATSVTLGLQSHSGLECGCLSYGIFARQCQGSNQFLQLHVVHCWHVINNASQRLGEGEGETLTMQRPLNCTFHDTARAPRFGAACSVAAARPGGKSIALRHLLPLLLASN